MTSRQECNMISCDCGGKLDGVTDTRPFKFSEGAATVIRRTRKCTNCGKRKPTIEMSEHQLTRLREGIMKEVAVGLIQGKIS